MTFSSDACLQYIASQSDICVSVIKSSRVFTILHILLDVHFFTFHIKQTLQTNKGYKPVKKL